MKKSLVALAVLGAFAGAASAQSSVTIYGLLNVGIQKGNGGTAINPQAVVGPAGGRAYSKAWQLTNYGTSRLGFRGTEDLGGGMSAQFQIEHRFSPDTGAVASATSFWNGRSFVQLTQAGVGSVYLGRDYSPIFWIQLKSDPFLNDGLGQASSTGLLYAGYATPDPVGAGARTSNTVGFKTANFGGLTANVAVGLSEDTQLGRNMGFNVEYSAGPLWTGFGYEKISKGVNDGLGLVNVGLSYDLGVAKLIGYYANSTTRAPGTTNREVSNKAYLIGATAPLGGGVLKGYYGRVSPATNLDRSKVGLGYDYPLSKRTNLFVDAGLAREDRQTNNNVYAFGVKHTF